MGTMGFQVGDLDLDGWVELLFGNGGPVDSGDEVNWLVSARPSVTGKGIAWTDRTAYIDVPAPVPPGAEGSFPPYPYRTHGSLFLDYDQDGDVDLFLGNGGAQADQAEPNRLFRNEAEPKHGWILLDLQGPPGNPDGLGAFIGVTEGSPLSGGWAVRHHLAGSSGFLSNAPPQAPDRGGPAAGSLLGLRALVQWQRGSPRRRRARHGRGTLPGRRPSLRSRDKASIGFWVFGQPRRRPVAAAPGSGLLGPHLRPRRPGPRRGWRPPRRRRPHRTPPPEDALGTLAPHDL